MKLAQYKLLGIALLCAGGLVACDKPGPAESAGKKLDQSVDTASKKLGEAVDKAGVKLDTESAKAGVAIDDTEITAKVKAAIFAEPGLKSMQIAVDTVGGVVSLSGSVDSPASGERAKALASAVSGVKSVDSRLVAK